MLDWLDALGPYFAALVALAAASFAVSRFRLERRAKEAEDIRRKLIEFYGPFQVLRQKSHLLRVKLGELMQAKGETWKESGGRMLKYFLLGHTVDGNAKALMDEIVVIGKQCEDLIEAKAGLVDEAKIRAQLPEMTVHFTVLRLAYLKKHKLGTTETPKNNPQNTMDWLNAYNTIGLDGEVDLFDDSVFPTVADRLVRNRIQRLNERLQEILDGQTLERFFTSPAIATEHSVQ